MTITPAGCHLCAGFDHWADACPELEPAANRAEHQARITKYVEWWTDGRITTEQKRNLIETESGRWKNAHARR